MVNNEPQNKAKTIEQIFYICSLGDIPVNSAKGYTIGESPKQEKIILVRNENQVFAYVNCCPHTGVNLDWTPDQFLDSSGSLLQCSTHGALFRIDNGFCIFGPCAGMSLTGVDVLMDGDKINIKLRDY